MSSIQTPPASLTPGPETQELHAARQRLRVLSTKHAKLLRPKSIDALSDVISSVSTTTPLPTALSPFSPSTPQADFLSDQPSSLSSENPAKLVLEIAEPVAAALTFAPPSDVLPTVAASPSCPCVSVTANTSDTIHCALCSAQLPVLQPLLVDKLTQLSLLLEKLSELQNLVAIEASQTEEAAVLMTHIEDLAVLSDALVEETARHNGDLDVLNDKMKDEITRKTDLEKDIEALKDELDELTASLTREANVLVADETRQRQALEEQEKELEKNILEMRDKLKREQVKLQELKKTMEKEFATVVDSNLNGAGKIKPIDELMLSEFKEFVSLAPNTKISKLPYLRFMQNIIEDDVMHTLRFGGNPRTSTRKLLDSIAADLLIVQDMDTLQFANWLATNQTISEAVNGRIKALNEARSSLSAVSTTQPQISALNPRSRTNSEYPVNFPPLSGDASKAIMLLNGISNSPTHQVFQKSMVERVSSWTSSSSALSPETLTTAVLSGSSNSGTPTADSVFNFPAFFVLSGCSTCGKLGSVEHHFKIMDPSAVSQLSTVKPVTPPIPTPVSTVISSMVSSSISQSAEASNSAGWVPICENCFDRLDSVARFYEFVRALRTGVYARRDPEEMFREVAGMRRDMFLSRVSGISLSARRKSLAITGVGVLRKSRVGSVISVGSTGLGRQMGSTSRLSSEIV